MFSDLVSPQRVITRSNGVRVGERVILVDRTPCSDLLSGPRGRAVWPIRNEVDQAAVWRACESRAITIRDVVGRPAVPRRTRGAVFAVGDATTRGLAQLYAYLTGRSYLPGAMTDLPSDAVVVTTLDAVTSELLASLYVTRGTSAAPGLICAADPESLRRQVLTRAIFAVWPELDLDLPWTAVFPLDTVNSRQRGGLRTLGAASTAAEVRKAITTRSGLLAVATHSDGVDAMLAPSLVLCGVNAAQLEAPLDREPSCLVNNHCHRFGVPVAKVAALGGMIAPADISAGVMIFDTCFGTLAADAPINIQRGLGGQLVENLNIGALATTWELTMLDPGKVRDLIHDLGKGMSVGRAVARFNRSAVARRHAARLALFGDPRTRFPPCPDAAAGMPRGVERTVMNPPVAPDMLQELGFSRACLTQGMTDLSAQLETSGANAEPLIRKQLAVASHALALLRRFELAPARRAADGRCAEALRRALIEDAFIRRPLDDWKGFADKGKWSHCRCGGCDAPSWVGVMGVRVPGVSPRRVVLCPRCNLCEDMPVHVRVNLRFDAATGLCRLIGEPPRRDWSSALILRTRDETRDRMWEWPAAAGGEPSRQMRVPERLPPGPSRLAVIMAHGGWLAWTATDVHGGPA